MKKMNVYNKKLKKLVFVFIVCTIIIFCIFQFNVRGMIPVFHRRSTPSVLMAYDKHLAKFQETRIENEKRRSHLTSTCNNIKDLNYKPGSQEMFDAHFKFDPRLKLGYCKIEKVASSFIWEIFTKLKRSGLNSLKLLTLRDHINKGLFFDIQNSTDYQKIMFVREPYGRLLSAYVDKLFAPNIVFWNYGWGVVQHLANLGRHAIHECGHITFPEHVEFMVIMMENESYLDGHFALLHQHCQPCRVSYDFIGKIESFNNDILYLVNNWNKKYHINITYDDFETDSDMYIIRTNVNRLFKMKKKLLDSKCMSFYEALWRTWRVLQIRGVLPIEVDLPFTKKESKNLSYLDFSKAAERTFLSIHNRTLVKQQRKESFIEAFSLLSPEMKERLQKCLEIDCKLFGYNPRPFNVFDIHPEPERNIKYFKLPL